MTSILSLPEVCAGTQKRPVRPQRGPLLPLLSRGDGYLFPPFPMFDNRLSGWPQGPFLHLGTQNAFALLSVVAAAFAFQVIGTQVAVWRHMRFFERLSYDSFLPPNLQAAKLNCGPHLSPNPALLRPVTLIQTLTPTLAFYPLPSVIIQGSSGSCSGSFPRSAARPQGLSRQPWGKRDPKSPKGLLKQEHEVDHL